MKLLIVSCDSPSKWYANKIGDHVPFLEDCDNEWKSLEDPDPKFGNRRFVNFISKNDAELVHEYNITDEKYGG